MCTGTHTRGPWTTEGVLLVYKGRSGEGVKRRAWEGEEVWHCRNLLVLPGIRVVVVTEATVTGDEGGGRAASGRAIRRWVSIWTWRGAMRSIPNRAGGSVSPLMTTKRAKPPA